jgi:ubiquinone/menaquinone biosynthesis C-methylase UbiE
MSDPAAALMFTGSIPERYDQYLGSMFFEPYALEIAQRIDPSMTTVALELGCGTGRVTRHLRRVLPQSCKLIASDLSVDMLAVARNKLGDLPIDWQIIDAHQLPFERNSLDVVVCAFAYMFVADKEKAFGEAFRVLKPGGSFILTTWDKLESNEASFVFRRTVKKYFGDTLPETYRLPYSMNDPLMLQRQLETAGFRNATVEIVRKHAVCDSAQQAAQGLVNGGSLYNEIMNRNPAWLDEIMSSVENELSLKYGASPMVAPMSALLAVSEK